MSQVSGVSGSGWKIFCEVGCIGFVADYTMLDILGAVKRKAIKSSLEAMEKAPIWLCVRTGNLWVPAAGTQVEVYSTSARSPERGFPVSLSVYSLVYFTPIPRMVWSYNHLLILFTCERDYLTCLVTASRSRLFVALTASTFHPDYLPDCLHC